MFTKYKAIHFVGIGGVGMSGIAEVLFNLGYEVSGSDLKETETTKRLRNLGIAVYIGHRAINVKNAHVVVISSAVSADNPEVLTAKQLGIPVIARAEMLAELGRLKYSILIAGAHGKTTTTSLIATILAEASFDPTVVIGGRLNSLGSNAKLGSGQFLVAEADESDGSFLRLSPTIAVVTNIDREHMDFFKTMQALKEAFLAFVNKIPFYGTAAMCLDNNYVRELLPLLQRRAITYGLNLEADMYPQEIVSKGMHTEFNAIYKGNLLGRFSLPMPGMHNVLNSLASIIVALELDIPVATIKSALAEFKGVHRRFELKGMRNGITVIDDYGHHPTEIRAVIKSALECFEGYRINVLFQPHRYSRTDDLFDEFVSCLSLIDNLFLLDIYPAGEVPTTNISSKDLAESLKEQGKDVYYLADKQKGLSKVDVAKAVIRHLKAGDVLITLGAGDVYKIGECIISDEINPEV